MIAKEMSGPKEHLRFYDKYKDLITRKVTEHHKFALTSDSNPLPVIPIII